MTGHSENVSKRAVWGWVIYDLANTIFSMGVVSLYFPLWMRETVGAARADQTYGVVTAASMAVIFILGPFLGALTDQLGRRMPFLIVSTVVCVLCTSLMGRGAAYWTIAAFVLANIAYQAGLQFYDALLPNVSSPENRGRIGGIGVAVGYLGSLLAVGLGSVVPSDDRSVIFLVIALSFGLLSIPCFVFVREKVAGRLSRAPLTDAWSQVRETFKNVRSYPGLARFLVGRVFYTDAVNTVIAVMALFAVNVLNPLTNGESTESAEASVRKVMSLAIVFAILGGFIWGRVVDRIGSRRTLLWVLRLWMAVLLAAALMGAFFPSATVLYIVAIFCGFALAGVWCADRPLMLVLTPKDRIGEFYGLYGMMGRFAAISGPLLWALGTSIGTKLLGLTPIRSQSVSLSLLLALVVVSHVILRKLPLPKAAFEPE